MIGSGVPLAQALMYPRRLRDVQVFRRDAMQTVLRLSGWQSEYRKKVLILCALTFAALC